MWEMEACCIGADRRYRGPRKEEARPFHYSFFFSFLLFPAFLFPPWRETLVKTAGV